MWDRVTNIGKPPRAIPINSENNRLESKNKIVKFDYEHYIDACKKMAEEIKANYEINDDVELIGMARGGLPMLVTLSHMLGIFIWRIFKY